MNGSINGRLFLTERTEGAEKTKNINRRWTPINADRCRNVYYLAELTEGTDKKILATRPPGLDPTDMLERPVRAMLVNPPRAVWKKMKIIYHPAGPDRLQVPEGHKWKLVFCDS